jgi:putative transposase
MDELQRETIANQRFQLIAPVVSLLRQNLVRGERYALLHQIVTGKHEGVSLLKKIGLRTLERYLALYESGGINALKPKTRQRTRKIPQSYLDAACELKRENLSRSIDTIISMLEHSGKVPQGVLKASTVYDYFTKHQLTRPTIGTKTGRYTRYGASHRGEILQGDCHHTLKLPDPNHEGQYRQVYLIAWLDDYSRMVYAQFYWKERLPALEDSLKKWILLYCCPQSIYCDNGAIYSSHHLQNICSALGIKLHHSRPYRPQGRGKIEKFFQFVDSSFKTEAELLISQGKLTTLTDLNNLFSVWLHRFYNQKVHSATKQTPLSRWNGSDYHLNKPSLETLHEAFLFKEERTVSKTGIISVDTNDYEVEPFLCGKKISIRYDPYDLSRGIRIYYDGKQYPDAIPAKIHRHRKKGFDASHSAPQPTGLNFLEQLADMELSKKESVKFANLIKDGDF